ncbi:unnamed protein product [Amoebophrya sp. A25]|nr:unnamed protein product [Amoebophrya sp. A25]|eukprot:GSA25T00002873001.1
MERNDFRLAATYTRDSSAKASGGVLLFISRRIVLAPKQPEPLRNSTLEVARARILLPGRAGNRSAVIAGIYRPPRKVPTTSMLRALYTTGGVSDSEDVLLAGDFNASSGGGWFENWFWQAQGEDGLLDLSHNQRTYPAAAPTTAPDQILWRPGNAMLFPELIRTALDSEENGDQSGLLVTTHDQTLSDHRPQTVFLQTEETDPPRSRTRRYKLPQDTAGKQQLTAKLHEISETFIARPVETPAKELARILLQSVEDVLRPYRRLEPVRGKSTSPAEIVEANLASPHVQEYIEAVQIGDDAAAEKIHVKMKREGWRRFLETMRPGASATPLWKFLAREDGRMPHLRQTVASALRRPDTTWATSDRDKATLLGGLLRDKHFAAAEHPATLPRDIGIALAEAPPAPDVTPGEVNAACDQLAAGKAPGPDGIPHDFWSEPLHGCLARLFSKCLAENVLPHQLGEILVIWLDKPGKDPTSPASYRPISLICSAAKILEKVILNRLPSVAEAEQYAYQPGKSCELLLAEFVEHVDTNARQGFAQLVLETDIAGAFDSVPHTKLIEQLIELKIPL